MLKNLTLTYYKFVIYSSSYEVRTLLLNGVSVSNIRMGHWHSYDTCKPRIHEVSNSKSIC